MGPVIHFADAHGFVIYAFESRSERKQTQREVHMYTVHGNFLASCFWIGWDSSLLLWCGLCTTLMPNRVVNARTMYWAFTYAWQFCTKSALTFYRTLISFAALVEIWHWRYGRQIYECLVRMELAIYVSVCLSIYLSLSLYIYIHIYIYIYTYIHTHIHI